MEWYKSMEGLDHVKNLSKILESFETRPKLRENLVSSVEDAIVLLLFFLFFQKESCFFIGFKRKSNFPNNSIRTRWKQDHTKNVKK